MDLSNCNCYCLIFLLVLCPESNTQVIMVLAMEQQLCWTFVGLQWEPLCEESVGFVSVSSQLFGRAQTCCHNSYTGLSVFVHGLGSTIIGLLDYFVCWFCLLFCLFVWYVNIEFVQFTEVQFFVAFVFLSVYCQYELGTDQSMKLDQTSCHKSSCTGLVIVAMSL